MFVKERPFAPVLVLALKHGTRGDALCVRNEDVRRFMAGKAVETRWIARSALLPAVAGSERWFYCEWRTAKPGR